MAYYPNLVPPLKATRTTSLDGKTAGGGPTNKGDTLENWEGYRTFRDGRSQTGWSDTSGHVIGGIDTHGYPLLFNKDTGKLDYNVHHHGGIDLSSLGSIGKYATGLIGGLGKSLTGSLLPGGVGALNPGALPEVMANQNAGLGFLNQIGAAGAAVLTGGIATGGGAGMDLGDIFSTGEGGQLPDWLQTIQEGISIFGGGGQAPAPSPTAPPSGGAAGAARALGGAGVWIMVGLGALVIFALARGVRRSH